MEDTSRTFAETPEYDLSKDYLSVPPKKKRSMVLSLGCKSSTAFGADQTPTPTRFIRNCEEVGLFQDLQNVNPFEETFRRAVESGKTGTSALQNSKLNVVTDDTLHTPHVFPTITENDFSSQKSRQEELGPEVEVSSTQAESAGLEHVGVKSVRPDADMTEIKPIAPALLPKNPSVPQSGGSHPVQLVLQMPDGRLMQLNATPIDTSAPLQGPIHLVAQVDKPKADKGNVRPRTVPIKKGETDNISPLIKERLKARLGHPSAFSVVQRASSFEQTSVNADQRGTGSTWSQQLKVVNNAREESETKRMKLLERNRAAAMRCREKRKCLMEALERQAENMGTTNQELLAEVAALKAEVASLKTMLLAHKDCPVTRAMCANSQLVTAPRLTRVVIPVPAETLVTPINSLATEENVKKKLKFFTVKKALQKPSIQSMNRVVLPKKKRLSLDIEMARQATAGCKEPLIIRRDAYLSSAAVCSEPLELEASRPVATQVIKINPNVMFRDIHHDYT